MLRATALLLNKRSALNTSPETIGTRMGIWSGFQPTKIPYPTLFVIIARPHAQRNRPCTQWFCALTALILNLFTSADRPCTQKMLKIREYPAIKVSVPSFQNLQRTVLMKYQIPPWNSKKPPTYSTFHADLPPYNSKFAWRSPLPARYRQISWHDHLHRPVTQLFAQQYRPRTQSFVNNWLRTAFQSSILMWSQLKIDRGPALLCCLNQVKG